MASTKLTGDLCLFGSEQHCARLLDLHRISFIVLYSIQLFGFSFQKWLPHR
jgi:hypothetical protein